MKTIATLVCTTGLAAVSSAARAQAPAFSAARQLILEGMARDSVPAVAVAVVQDGKIIWEEGFGWADPRRHVAATPNTPFALASVTKSFVAVAAMALHARGQLDLDRPVNEYLRTAKVWSPAWNPNAVTLRRLLNHTAGLSTFELWCTGASGACTLPSADETIERFGAVASRPAVPMSSSAGLAGLTVGEGRSGEWDGFASVHDLALFGAFLLETPLSGQRKILPDAAIDSMLMNVASLAPARSKPTGRRRPSRRQRRWVYQGRGR